VRVANPEQTQKDPSTELLVCDLPKMEDVAKAKQELVKVARTKNKKTPRTWVIVYKLLTGRTWT